MDTWMGRSNDPLTLHKYAYADMDPLNNIDPSGHFSISEVMSAINIQARLAVMNVRIGSSLLGHSAVRTGAPVLYGLNHLLAKLGSSNIASSVRNATHGLYQRINLHPNLLRLDAGKMWEATLNPAMQYILRAAPQVRMYGARADWIWRGKHVIDAKLGQYISTSQMSHFARFAAERGGSVTYISLTRPPISVYNQLTTIANRYGTKVSVFWLLP